MRYSACFDQKVDVVELSLRGEIESDVLSKDDNRGRIGTCSHLCSESINCILGWNSIVFRRSHSERVVNYVIFVELRLVYSEVRGAIPKRIEAEGVPRKPACLRLATTASFLMCFYGRTKLSLV